MSSAVNGFVHAVRKHLQKVPRTKSGTFRFTWTDSHDSTTSFVALVLLYNTSLERSFSIERFQSYTLLNISAKLHFNV